MKEAEDRKVIIRGQDATGDLGIGYNMMEEARINMENHIAYDDFRYTRNSSFEMDKTNCAEFYVWMIGEKGMTPSQAANLHKNREAFIDAVREFDNFAADSAVSETGMDGYFSQAADPEKLMVWPTLYQKTMDALENYQLPQIDYTNPQQVKENAEELFLVSAVLDNCYTGMYNAVEEGIPHPGADMQALESKELVQNAFSAEQLERAEELSEQANVLNALISDAYAAPKLSENRETGEFTVTNVDEVVKKRYALSGAEGKSISDAVETVAKNTILANNARLSEDLLDDPAQTLDFMMNGATAELFGKLETANLFDEENLNRSQEPETTEEVTGPEGESFEAGETLEEGESTLENTGEQQKEEVTGTESAPKENEAPKEEQVSESGPVENAPENAPAENKPQEKEEAVKEDPSKQYREYELPSEEILKNSLHNPQQYLDVFATSHATKEEIENYIQNDPLYLKFDPEIEGSVYGPAYGELDEDDGTYTMETLPVRMPRFGANALAVTIVQDEKAFEEYKTALKEISADIDQRFTQRLNSTDQEVAYINDLYKERDREETVLENLKQEKEKLIDEGFYHVNEPLRQERVRIDEATEKTRQEAEANTQRIQALEEQLKNLPEDTEDLSGEYNPFKPRSARAQAEMALEMEKQRQPELAAQLQQQQKALQTWQEKWNAQRADWVKEHAADENLVQADEKIRTQEARIQAVSAQIERDANPDRFEACKNKASAVMHAMVNNRIERGVEGYSQAYLATQMPFDHGMNAFGPCINLSDQPISLTSKIAEAERIGFPVYDAMIQTDAATQTMVDYMKEKGKGPLSPEQEKGYRRTLYDQVSRLENSLNMMYKASEDPEKNEDIRLRGITDPGNEPYHMHRKSSRGTQALYSGVQAYKVGMENNWTIEDCNGLYAFNYVREAMNREVLTKPTVTLADVQDYKEPKYKSEDHKKWLEGMNEIWDKVKTTKLDNPETRKNLLDEMEAQVKKGKEAGYIPILEGTSFSINFSQVRKRDLLIEQGKEKAFEDPMRFTVSARTKQEAEKLEKADKIYDIGRNKEKKEEQKEEQKEEIGKEQEQKEPEQSGPDESMSSILMDDESLNKSFRAEDAELYMDNLGQEGKDLQEEEAGETLDEAGNLEFAKAVEKFTTKRSAVFLGRESEEHKNLRQAVESMNEMRHNAKGMTHREDMKNYLEKLDEVIYRSRVYQKEKAGADTEAGKARLQGAKDIEKFCKEERQAVLELYRDKTKTESNSMKIRENIAEEKAAKAKEELQDMCAFGMPSSAAGKKKAAGLAADILAANLANSKVESNYKGFHAMGRLAIKHDIMESKEFKAAMSGYFKKEGMTADKMIEELSNGKTMSRMQKLHKKMENDQKQRVQEAQKEAANKQKQAMRR